MFLTTYKLPVAQQIVKYSDFTNTHLLDVIKYSANNNLVDLEKCFDDVLSDMTDVDVSSMINVDKFCLLLDIRSMFIGDQIEIKNTTGASVKLKISTLSNNIETSILSYNTTTNIDVGDLSIQLGLPHALTITNDDQLISQCIQQITHNNNHTKFTDFNETQQQAFIESLPADTMQQITTFIKHVDQNVDLCLIPSNSSIGIEGLNVKVYDGSMTQTLKSLYSDDLMNFYEMQFNLITKMRVSYEHFMKMTPNESKIFVSLYNKDIKKQEEAMNKQQQQSNPHSRGVGGI